MRHSKRVLVETLQNELLRLGLFYEFDSKSVFAKAINQAGICHRCPRQDIGKWSSAYGD